GDKTPGQVELALQQAITPEALLLMPAVDEISLRGPTTELVWRKRRGRRRGKGRIVSVYSSAGRRAWLIAESSVALPKKLRDELRDDAWTDVRQLKVLVGLPWRGEIDGSAPAERLHVYFPTDDQLGCAMLVHGDF